MPLMDNLDYIANLYTSDVEEIIINKSGSGYGQLGSGGVIKINTKKTFLKNLKKNELFSFITNNGYLAPKEFYSPQYSTYDSSIFSNYGLINWISNMEISANEQSFKIPNTRTDEFVLYIEGITRNGYLSSEKIILKAE